MRNDFAVMICSHGRAETLTSYDMLRNQGYTGKIFVVIDDEDEQEEQYKKRFDCVEVFCKEAEYIKADGVIPGKQKGILYARNACYDIAKRHDVKYFAEIDDDFSGLYFRYESEGKCKAKKINPLDGLFEVVCDLFESESLYAASILSQGNYIGGIKSAGLNKAIRICTSMFFLSTERRIDFISSMNEDVCTCMHYGKMGKVFIGLNGTMCETEPIGNNRFGNGMAEFYQKTSPYFRQFIPVIVRPDCMYVMERKETIKGGFRWANAVPMIINERYKRA